MHRNRLVALAAASALLGLVSISSSASAQQAAKPRVLALVVSPEETTPRYARDKSAEPGIQLGIRSGYAVGFGDVYSGLSLSDGSYGAVPILVDAGYRIVPELYVGAYGQWAHVVPRTNSVSCPESFSCGVQDWRFGLQVDWHFAPRVSFDPYVGVGAGYEVLTNSVHGPAAVPTPRGVATANVDANTTDRGWEFLNLTAGADFRIAHALGIGPFVTGTLGSYNVHSGDQAVSVGGSQVAGGPLPQVNERVHTLLVFGARGTFNLTP